MAVDQVDPLISSIYHWMDISGVLLMGVIGGTMARQLAKYEVASLTSLGRQAKQSERGRDWGTLMRVRDPGALDAMDTWSAISRYGDKRRLRIPVGFLSNGDRLVDNVSAGAYGSQLGSTFIVMATVKQGVDPATVEAAIDEARARDPDDPRVGLTDPGMTGRRPETVEGSGEVPAVDRAVGGRVHGRVVRGGVQGTVDSGVDGGALLSGSGRGLGGRPDGPAWARARRPGGGRGGLHLLPPDRVRVRGRVHGDRAVGHRARAVVVGEGAGGGVRVPREAHADDHPAAHGPRHHEEHPHGHDDHDLHGGLLLR